MNDYEQELLNEARSLLSSESESLESEKLNDEVLICECMCISVGEIREHIRNGDVNLSVLSQELMLGSGCSSCFKSFEQWKDKI